jgi:nucleotide-binding universal stress UspA family protein
MKTILVPIDLSAATARVCDAARTLAKLIQARLVLFHNVQTPPFLMNDYYAFDTGMMSEVVAAGEKIAAKKLEVLRQRYAKQQLQVKAIQVTGHPVASILAQAASSKAAYIVLGSHGHGAVFDLLVGSTTHGVLSKARCPVLVVPITES